MSIYKNAPSSNGNQHANSILWYLSIISKRESIEWVQPPNSLHQQYFFGHSYCICFVHIFDRSFPKCCYYDERYDAELQQQIRMHNQLALHAEIMDASYVYIRLSNNQRKPALCEQLWKRSEHMWTVETGNSGILSSVWASSASVFNHQWNHKVQKLVEHQWEQANL